MTVGLVEIVAFFACAFLVGAYAGMVLLAKIVERLDMEIDEALEGVGDDENDLAEDE